jgi:hypothetical protein
MSSHQTGPADAAEAADLDRIDRWVRDELGDVTGFKGVGYLNEYVRILGPRLREVSFIVELGVAEGASLLAWSRLCPRARCLGIDREPAPKLDAAIERLGLRERLALVLADHNDIGTIEAAIDGRPDLIVDDGSHLLETTRRCFFRLFDRLAPGGWYCVEDWGAGYWESYGGPHAGVHRLLYEVLDEIALPDRAKPEAGRYRQQLGRPLPISDFRVSTKEPIAYIQRA